jgi:hypothetical protein
MATAESTATNSAENQSHHSRRASCRRPNSARCARIAPGPSRGEGLDLPARRPSRDSMILQRRRNITRLGRGCERRQRGNGTGCSRREPDRRGRVGAVQQALGCSNEPGSQRLGSQSFECVRKIQGAKERVCPAGAGPQKTRKTRHCRKAAGLKPAATKRRHCKKKKRPGIAGARSKGMELAVTSARAWRPAAE